MHLWMMVVFELLDGRCHAWVHSFRSKDLVFHRVHGVHVFPSLEVPRCVGFEGWVERGGSVEFSSWSWSKLLCPLSSRIKRSGVEVRSASASSLTCQLA